MKIQKILIDGGQGFVLHKITSHKFTGKCSAWYWPDGRLYDAEWIRRDGVSRLIPIGSPMWRYLESLGPVWK